jgi:hypothetical protein
MANFPAIVENRLNEMSNSDRNAFYEEYERRRKSVLVGYLLLIPLGWHYAYVKKWGTQFLCWFTLWGLFLWWLIDWFRIPSIVGRYNKDLSVKIMTEMSLIYGNKSVSINANSESDLEIWLKENPSKSVNDYYYNRK